jgi:hypothetical protein
MAAISVFEPDLIMSEAEYLAFEAASETKHEFVMGTFMTGRATTTTRRGWRARPGRTISCR